MTRKVSESYSVYFLLAYGLNHNTLPTPTIATCSCCHSHGYTPSPLTLPPPTLQGSPDDAGVRVLARDALWLLPIHAHRTLYTHGGGLLRQAY